MQPIDYTPLDKMQSSIFMVLKYSLNGYGWLLIVIFAAGFLAMAPYTPLALIFVYPLIGYVLYLSIKLSKYKNNAWKEFAAINGWSLDDKTSIFELLPPSVNYGHNQIFSPIIRVNTQNNIFDLFTYSTDTPIGKEEQTHEFTIAMIKLPKMMPHMILNSKQSAADIRETLNNHKHLTLEGDFNEFFDLLIEKDQEIDALEIITPDIMRTLIDHNTHTDIEINGLYIYLIKRGTDRRREAVKDLINDTIALYDQLSQNIKLATG